MKDIFSLLDTIPSKYDTDTFCTEKRKPRNVEGRSAERRDGVLVSCGGLQSFEVHTKTKKAPYCYSAL
jgi:hypothetical protein